jgi:hypothetical protein
MSKISRVIALIIASMAVALAGCAKEREVATAGEAGKEAAKFAEHILTALRTSTHWNKQEELKDACGVYNVPEFMMASDKTRWLEAKFNIPSAKAAELADLAEEIARLPEHPTAQNLTTATARAICQGQEAVEWFRK